jgi:hypothetical protein
MTTPDLFPRGDDASSPVFSGPVTDADYHGPRQDN